MRSTCGRTNTPTYGGQRTDLIKFTRGDNEVVITFLSETIIR